MEIIPVFNRNIPINEADHVYVVSITNLLQNLKNLIDRQTFEIIANFADNKRK